MTLVDPELIDLRSDAATHPTAAMMRAAAVASLGDDTLGEDPTTRRLEAAIAERLGTAAALFVLSGTMANLLALLAHCRPGDEVFLDSDAHVLRNEAGGLTAIAGVVPTPVESDRGHMLPDALERVIRPAAVFRPRPRLVWLENTHNRGGGSLLRPTHQAQLIDVARRHGLAVHLDGARLFNAAVALGSAPADVALGVDSITVDFTKGLSCAAGAALAGPGPLIEDARRWRRTLGGGMRQSGVLAAPCLVALESMVDRLAEDHRLAKILVIGLAGLPGLTVDPPGVETNIVFADVSALGGSAVVAPALASVGILVSAAPPSMIRLVTHQLLDTGSISEAIGRIREVIMALGVPA